MNKAELPKQRLLYFLLLLGGLAYYFLSFKTDRENFLQVIILFTFLFLVYGFIYNYFSNTHFKQLLIAGILFRCLLLFSIPHLSDDVYRFIWDGRLAANGINPFSYLPTEIMKMTFIPKGITPELFGQLNSPRYFTIYPPLMQGVFWLGAKLFTQNIFGAILFFKSIIVLFEAGTFFLIYQLLKKLSLPTHFSFLYFLNPLVIVELTGNVHFEGIMLFFLLLSFLLLFKHKWKTSAIFLGAGIATKIIPILFIPLVVQKLGWKKGMIYAAISGLITVILFSFILDYATLEHLGSSINLFFRNFEFNASLYYAVRWIGEQITGYNIIAKAGPLLSLTAALIIIIISFQKNSGEYSFFIKSLFIITTWFLCATTVHPWYIITVIAISVFTKLRFAIVWSYTALLSYAAYQYHPVKENLWLLAAGYIMVIAYGVWELKFKTQVAV